MDLKSVIELLGKDHGPADEMTGAFLEDAIATFTTNPAGATNAIRQLQAGDPAGFALSAVRLLATRTDKSPGVQYIAGLLFAGNLLIDPLLDEEALPMDAAIALARNLSTAEPLLDARLLRKMMANAGGEIRGIKASTALRVLRIAEAISDCSRLSSYLIQLMRHPSAEVRSKVALLLGRANLNLNRVKSFLSSDDPRLRANAVESLWEHRAPEVQQVLREASKDASGRAAVNALLGLCRRGETEAFERLRRLATSSDPVLRSGAAWAMGETHDPQFAPDLEALASDPDSKVRAMVERSRSKLPRPDAPDSSSEPQQPQPAATDSSTHE